jgi:hypothetical protein
MRTHPDYDPVLVYWFRVPDDRPFITGFSPFRSRDWIETGYHPNADLGEQRPWDGDCCIDRGPWYRGLPPDLYFGLNYCGTQDDWENGPPPGKDPIITIRRGTAPCCIQICPPAIVGTLSNREFSDADDGDS